MALGGIGGDIRFCKYFLLFFGYKEERVHVQGYAGWVGSVLAYLRINARFLCHFYCQGFRSCDHFQLGEL